MKGIRDKVAIVTGGATLIGEAVASTLIEHGASVVLADIDEGRGPAAADRLGPAARFIATDVTDDAQIAATVAATVKALGGIDLLVNCACTYVDNGAASSRGEWRQALDVNLVGAAMMLQACRPEMVKRGGGAVVNFGSISATAAQAGRWLYPVSKAGMLELTRAAALDLAGDGIRVERGLAGLDLVERDRDAFGRRQGQGRCGRRGLSHPRPPRPARRGRAGRRLPAVGPRQLRHRR